MLGPMIGVPGACGSSEVMNIYSCRPNIIRLIIFSDISLGSRFLKETVSSKISFVLVSFHLTWREVPLGIGARILSPYRPLKSAKSLGSRDIRTRDSAEYL